MKFSPNHLSKQIDSYNMNRDEKLKRIKELHDERSRNYLTTDEYEELADYMQDIINMYRKCIDINEVSEEELEELDYQ